jgi:NAD(P)-dependent dehydrogenase (short-subunit alcohol dehydrogenase family)
VKEATLVTSQRLAGRTVAVLGAGSVGPGWGNGRACAVRASEEGAHVVLVDRDASALTETERLIADGGGQYSTYIADLTDDREVRELFAQVGSSYRDHPPLRGVVCAVGGSIKGGVRDLSMEDWHRSLQRNLESAFLALKYSADLLADAGGGSAVLLGSTSGLRYTGAFQAGYAASKAGLAHLGRVVAIELAHVGVRVNTVTLGQLHTPMVEARLAAQRAGGDVEKLLAERASRTPLNVSADGRDTAAAACFLLSEDARFVTGTELVVDGGMSVRCD